MAETNNGPIVCKTATIDGKRIGYCTETEFLVQVGKGKSGYKTKYRIKGNLDQAIMWYRGINLGPGFKKRLLMPSASKNPVIGQARG
jgi:hypothetical protein